MPDTVKVKVWVCSIETIENTATAFVAGTEEAMLATLREQWGDRLDKPDLVPDEDLIQSLCDEGCIIFTDCQWVNAEPEQVLIIATPEGALVSAATQPHGFESRGAEPYCMVCQLPLSNRIHSQGMRRTRAVLALDVPFGMSDDEVAQRLAVALDVEPRIVLADLQVIL